MKLLAFFPWTIYQFGALVSGDPSDQKLLSPPFNTITNYAAYIPSPKAQLQVAEAPVPTCGPSELIIQNHAVAINPVDWKIQSSALFDLTYPAILGEDVAGTVIAVGSSAASRFHIGQRVISHTLGLSSGPSHGGFQLYPVLSAAATSPIPSSISFTSAAVLPLSISTAAAGLFMNATLGLRYPQNTIPVDDSSSQRPILLLWGGSSSVGSSVIQLAAAAGYTIITTASASNTAYCLSLGASHVLDYHEPDILSQLTTLIKSKAAKGQGNPLVGAYDAIGAESTVRQCAAVLHAFGGGTIASVGAAPGDLGVGDVEVEKVSSTDIFTREPEVGGRVWAEWVPWALEAGLLRPSPGALVVGEGLGSVQEALDRQKKGVSARKVVVKI